MSNNDNDDTGDIMEYINENTYIKYNEIKV